MLFERAALDIRDLIELHLRSFHLMHLLVVAAQLVVRRGVLRIKPHGFLQLCLRFLQASQAKIGSAEAQPALGVCSGQSHSRLQGRDRFRRLLQSDQQVAKI